MKISNSLENLYISPLEACNLHCRYCYTKKTKNVLTNKQILSFVRRYQNFLKKNRGRNFLANFNVQTLTERKKCDEGFSELKSIIFCGGEIFTLKSFPRLINKLNKLGIFITIITNGTIDHLSEIKNPNSCQLIVSFDGPKNIHDSNRGIGNYDLSKSFVRHALDLGFPTEIFFLITKDSYPYKDSFDIFGLPKTYLTDRLGSLAPTQVADIRLNYPSYPSKEFNCHQISLQSDGLVYPCCETGIPISKISTPIKKTITAYFNLVDKNPLCVDLDYFCNLKTISKQ
ncbi:MAG: radical SAM protein [Patescibacteria group bacterium]